jgi:purine-binding chemotaxis protein CheW
MPGRQYVTFRVEPHLLGIDILHVREVNQALGLTPVQRAPSFVRGMVNLRGQILTVFDLGVRLGLPARRITDESHNIILKSEAVGLLVDGVGDVVEANGDRLEAAPANLGGLQREFLEGVMELPQALLGVLSVEKLLEHGGAGPTS